MCRQKHASSRKLQKPFSKIGENWADEPTADRLLGPPFLGLSEAMEDEEARLKEQSAASVAKAKEEIFKEANP